MSDAGRSRWLWALVGAAAIGLALAALYQRHAGFREFLQEGWQVVRSGDQDRVAQWFSEFGLWGPVLIVGLMVVQMIVFFLPSWLPMIVAVLAYGPVKGAALAVLGVALVSSLGYWLGEVLSTATVNRLVSAKGRSRLENWVQRYGIGAVALFRISPFLSNDAISFVAGLVRMGYRRFLLATLLGIVPLAAAIAYFAGDLDRLRAGLLWIGGIGLLLYAVVVVVDHRRRRSD